MVSDNFASTARARRDNTGPRHLRLAPEPLVGRTGLPAQPTPLIGRDADVAALRARLWRADLRLLTLVGPGGIGKTRLAIAAAAEVAGDFTDGVCFVDLAPLASPELVPDAICRALGLRERPERPATERSREALRDRDLLLLLDNFEHLPEAARVVADLLDACPALVILVTSRTPLRLRWEQRYRVAPLPVPDLPDAPLAELAANPAVALFLDRARAVDPAFTLAVANSAPIAAICAHLDGLPLAIEMAAAQVGVLSPRALQRRLAGQLTLLKSDHLDRPDRHQTIVATIAWSHDLLAPVERAVFRRLAVFAGGADLHAADAVCGELRMENEEWRKEHGQAGAEAGGEQFSILHSEFSILAALGELVDHSLVYVEEDADGEPRYRMLMTIREYATARLAESGELPGCQRRLAEHLLGLAERAAPELTGPRQVHWLRVLARERENCRAALAWTIADAETALGLGLGAALWWGWYLRGDFREGQQWLARLLALPGEAESAARAACLVGAGSLAYLLGEPARAQELGEVGLALARARADRDLLGLALNLLGGVALWSGALDRARQLYGEAATLYREQADRRALLPREQFGLSLSLTNLGVVATSLGERREAIGHLEESLTLTRQLGDRQGTAHALARLAEVVEQIGDRDYALVLVEEARGLFDALGDRWGLARAQLALARLALARRDPARAAPLLGESLRFFAQAEVKLGLAACWEAIADLALQRGRAERAARLLGAAAALLVAVEAVPEAIERAERDRIVAATVAALGPGRAATAQRIGATLAPETAVAEALAELAASPPTGHPAPVAPEASPPAPIVPGADLTRRERELLPCLARGLSNRAIAAELHIGARTVEMHVANLLAKLRLGNRAQVAAWAAAHPLDSQAPPPD